MLTTVNLPDAVDLESQGNSDLPLPVIPSKRPGTMDLTGFDFDDLLT